VFFAFFALAFSYTYNVYDNADCSGSVVAHYTVAVGKCTVITQGGESFAFEGTAVNGNIVSGCDYTGDSCTSENLVGCGNATVGVCDDGTKITNGAAGLSASVVMVGVATLFAIFA